MPAGTQIVASAEAVHLHGAHGSTDMLFMLLVAFMLSYAVLDAACRVRAAHGAGRTAWLVGGSLVVGLGIFAFHFIALLSVGLPLPITADPVTFGVSAVTAVIAAAGALHHVNRGVAGVPPFVVSAGLKGFAFVATHYTSVAALHVPATVDYRPEMVLLSVVIAVGVSAIALWLAERLRSETPGRAALERAVGAGILAAGLVALHHVSAGAGRFVPDVGWEKHATSYSHLHHLPEAWLVPWVTAAGALAVVVLAIAATLSRRRHVRHCVTPSTDRLTGLANGARLRAQLTDALADGGCSLVLVRIKRFEQMSQRLGPRDAATLLVRVGQRLRAAARPTDLVATLGPGEFAILVDDAREVVGRDVAARIAERTSAPMRIGDLLVVVPSLVGVATAKAGDEAADVLRAAQVAAARTASPPPLAGLPEINEGPAPLPLGAALQAA